MTQIDGAMQECLDKISAAMANCKEVVTTETEQFAHVVKASNLSETMQIALLDAFIKELEKFAAEFAT